MYSFFSHLHLRLQKVLLWPKFFFSSKNINMGIQKRRILCWFQIRWCRLKQMPLKKARAKKLCEFWVFSFLCIFSWFFASDLCGLMISEMTLSNQSHFPRFFSPRKMTYRNLANSGLWQAGIGLSPVSHLAQSAKRIWWSQLPKVIFRGQAIQACRKPELVRPR